MDFIKKNWKSLACGVIALIAIVAAFFPLGGYYDALQEDLAKGEARWNKAKGLLKKPRTTPVVAPGQKPEQLAGFPTPRDISDAQTAQKSLHDEGRNILAQAVVKNIAEMACDGRPFDVPQEKLSTFDIEIHLDDRGNPLPNPVREAVLKAVLLVPNSLPDPTGNAPFAFQKALDAELKKIREVVLKGGTPPAQADIEKAEKALRALKDQDLQFPVPGQPARNQKQVDDDYEEGRAKIPARLREEAASRYLIYIEPGVLQADPAIKAGTPSKEQIWYAQSALWIQEDVARAIRETNAHVRPGNLPPATNVTESLVKRLAKLDIPLGADMYQRGTGAAGGGGEAAAPVRSGGHGGGEVVGGSTAGPIDVIPGGAEPPKPNPAISPSGRASNNLYDVIHFNLVVDVDSRAAQLFLNQLSRGRLIAVRKVDVTRPDLSEAANFGYIYTRGKEAAPIVQLNIDCEALLLREWTIPLMPTGAAHQTLSIREMLGVPTPYVSKLALPKKEEGAKP